MSSLRTRVCQVQICFQSHFTHVRPINRGREKTNKLKKQGKGRRKRRTERQREGEIKKLFLKFCFLDV